jgi:hypothetical protein
MFCFAAYMGRESGMQEKKAQLLDIVGAAGVVADPEIDESFLLKDC